MQALVTGGTGFIGNHVVRTLIRQGLDVRVLVRPTSNRQGLKDIPVTFLEGSLNDPGSLEQAVADIDVLFHVAADYRFWVPDPQQMWEVNVGGTRRLLETAMKAGVQRMVYTSSGVTVRCSDTQLGTEEDFVFPEECRSVYQRTKVLAEQTVWELIRQGAPITIVNPTTPIGGWDLKPTPTGRLIVDFLNGRLPAYLDAVFNWIAVEDVAFGHWLAAEKGRCGERYILGHENRSLEEVLALLGEVSGQTPPRFKIPYAVAYIAGAAGEMMGRLSGREPRASLDGVRMAGQPMRYDSRKAMSELGLPQTSLRKAMEEAVNWFRQHGYTTQGETR
ncbi:hopanoid-associated sugar epimerase [Candidatus Nitronereus thalassa]|uniref:NAD-dependent epimerase/dehydratase family protein n=1 Tax=Candidatus Nitronereus thalassa TaxID=3020898 RepID=A0ABU3K8X8_9BACT|nr:hopanoid-associated sugar epimerase [Candidatus Nitronereus thalassa]MDT7042867.1 NAD-dependent epimerase/dehydratase family protein [Candidatus Nitronereus thalassa]